VGADRLIRALALGALLLAGCAADEAALVAAGESGRVARIADGDTLRLTDGRRIRLVQIDAPEPGSECFGNDAIDELAALSPPGSEVELERDPALDDRDRFGRLLRYVHAADGTVNVNLVLVERGAAAPYFFRGDRGRYADDLLDRAEAARAARRGLWGACPAARLHPGRTLEAGNLRR
jgi:endonuclease YncB( thermonuclease family)